MVRFVIGMLAALCLGCAAKGPPKCEGPWVKVGVVAVAAVPAAETGQTARSSEPRAAGPHPSGHGRGFGGGQALATETYVAMESSDAR